MGKVSKTSSYGFVDNLRLFEIAYYDQSLTSEAIKLLGLIIRHSTQNGASRYFSVSKTAARKGVKRQTIQKYVQELERSQYIKRQFNTGQRSTYTLNLSKIDLVHPQTLESAGQPPLKSAPPQTLESAPPADSGICTKKNIDNIERGTNGQQNEEASLPDWLNQIKKLVNDDPLFRSWFLKLKWNGNGTIYAPSRFHAKHVTEYYQDIIHTVLPGVKIVCDPATLQKPP